VAAKGFVLIETAIGISKEVVDALRKLEGVDSVDSVTGPYDIIAVIDHLEGGTEPYTLRGKKYELAE